MDLRNIIIRICPNIKAMLIDRGYAPDSIPNTDFTTILDYKIKEFIDNEDDSNRILDFYVTNGETKDYVFLYKGGEKEFKINKVFFENKVKKYFNEIESSKGLNINFDNFTFVLVKRKITKVEKELVDNFESGNPHIRIFDYQKFLFNITAHRLVSKHALYKNSYSVLFKNLMLDSIDQFPYILHNDPVSKHFNFRDGAIIEIERDTLGKKIKTYRVCKNFNYSYLSYRNTIKLNESSDSYRIALTFGDAGENHAGMEMVGKLGKKGSGFTTAELKKAEVKLIKKGHTAEYTSFDKGGESAGVLIIRNYLNDEEHTDLLKDMNSFKWDTKYWDTRRKRVLNKQARSNIIILDGIKQEPDYENKKGTIIDGNTLRVFKGLKKNLRELINTATGTTKASNLICEGNRYYDLKKCGIGYHGDTERRKVIALSLGSPAAINWQWFQNSKPVGDTYKFTINGGDIYIMSEKAVGYDWRHTKGGLLTLRHAAGATKYTCLDKYNKKEEDITEEMEEVTEEESGDSTDDTEEEVLIEKEEEEVSEDETTPEGSEGQEETSDEENKDSGEQNKH